MWLTIRVGDLYRGRYGGLFLVTAIERLDGQLKQVSKPDRVAEASWRDTSSVSHLYWVNWMVYDIEFDGRSDIWDDDDSLESVLQMVIDGQWVKA